MKKLIALALVAVMLVCCLASCNSGANKVKVIDINEKGKIALSIKKALPEEEAPAPKKTYDKPKKSQPPVWTGTPKNEPENMSFEDMLARFKTKSDERMSDLKKNTAAKRGSSTPRRGGGNQRGF
jgi:S1 RNA binding domain protein